MHIHLAKSSCLIWLNKVTHIIVQGHYRQQSRLSPTPGSPIHKENYHSPAVGASEDGEQAHESSSLGWTMPPPRETEGVKDTSSQTGYAGSGPHLDQDQCVTRG